MDKARGEGSPFSWKRFRQPFLDALTAGAAEPFCVGWLEQLVEGRWGSLDEPFRVDPMLADTIDSLGLLLDWWLPMRVASSAEKAAQQLKEEIDHSLFFHLLEYNNLASEASEEGARNDYEKRSEQIDELREDAHFVARVAAHLVGYDPKGTDASPSAALRDAVRSELALRVGPFPAPWEPNLKSLGGELGRLFALSDDAPKRQKFEACVAKLSNEEREFIETMYKGGGSKMLEPGRWGGRRISRVGAAAKISLLRCMPELARFAMPDLARFAAGMSVADE